MVASVLSARRIACNVMRWCPSRGNHHRLVSMSQSLRDSSKRFSLHDPIVMMTTTTTTINHWTTPVNTPSVATVRSFHRCSSVAMSSTGSSKSNEGGESSSSGDVRSRMDFMRLVMRLWGQHLARYLAIFIALLAFAAAIYSISNWFSSINFKNVAVWSVYTGVLIGMCIAACAVALIGWFSIHPNAVYRTALSRVASNAQVLQKLGKSFTPGQFRSYKIEYTDFRGGMHNVPLSRRLQFWKPPRLQMMFPITGGNGKRAIVSCEVEKHYGIKGLTGQQFYFHSLAVDIPEDNDQTIIEGNAEKVVFKGDTKLY